MNKKALVRALTALTIVSLMLVACGQTRLPATPTPVVGTPYPAEPTQLPPTICEITLEVLSLDGKFVVARFEDQMLLEENSSHKYWVYSLEENLEAMNWIRETLNPIRGALNVLFGIEENGMGAFSFDFTFNYDDSYMVYEDTQCPEGGFVESIRLEPRISYWNTETGRFHRYQGSSLSIDGTVLKLGLFDIDGYDSGSELHLTLPSHELVEFINLVLIGNDFDQSWKLFRQLFGEEATYGYRAISFSDPVEKASFEQCAGLPGRVVYGDFVTAASDAAFETLAKDILNRASVYYAAAEGVESELFYDSGSDSNSLYFTRGFLVNKTLCEENLLP